MIDTPKGEQIPITVENLLEIMAADAVIMEGMGRELGRRNARIDRLTQKLAKCRRNK